MSIENAVASTELKHLTRQFYSAKALIISQQETIKHYSQKDFETNERRIKALQYSLNSEREMNANLTAELAELESKCERQASCNKELDRTNNDLEKERGALLESKAEFTPLIVHLLRLSQDVHANGNPLYRFQAWLEAHNLEQQKIGIQNATTRVDTHRPFRPISRYDGDVKIDADMWRKAYKKGYDDALVEVKHEGVKLRNQAKALRGE